MLSYFCCLKSEYLLKYLQLQRAHKISQTFLRQTLWRLSINKFKSDRWYITSSDNNVYYYSGICRKARVRKSRPLVIRVLRVPSVERENWEWELWQRVRSLQNALLCEDSIIQICRAFLERVGPRTGYSSKVNQISKIRNTSLDQITCCKNTSVITAVLFKTRLS